MAKKQKRSETLSIRISPRLKAGLQVAANIGKTSMASVIDTTLSEGLEKTFVKAEEVHPRLLERFGAQGGTVQLSKVMEEIWTDEPFLLTLRLYLLLPSGLTDREFLMATTVFKDETFAGVDDVFEGAAMPGLSYPLIDLGRAQLEQNELASYADYSSHESQRPGAGLHVEYGQYLQLHKDLSEKRTTRKELPKCEFRLQSADNSMYEFTFAGRDGRVLLEGEDKGDRLSIVDKIKRIKQICHDLSSYDLHENQDGVYEFFVQYKGVVLARSVRFQSKAVARSAIDTVAKSASAAVIKTVFLDDLDE